MKKGLPMKRYVVRRLLMAIPLGKIQKGQLLFQRKAVGLNKVSHSHAPFSTNFSRSAPVETNWISWPSCFSRNST